MAITLLQRYLNYADPQFFGRAWKGYAAGVGLLAGRGWAAPLGVYRLYCGADAPAGIDYGTPVGATAGGFGDALATVRNYAGFPLAASAVIYFGVRATGRGGAEYAVDHASLQIETDGGGVPLPAIPNSPQRLTAEHKAAGAFVLRWGYEPGGEQTPVATYNVYHDNGTGTIDYVTAIGSTGGQSFLTGGYADTTVVKLAVRSVSAAAAENTASALVTATADALGPYDLPAPTLTYGVEA